MLSVNHIALLNKDNVTEPLNNTVAAGVSAVEFETFVSNFVQNTKARNKYDLCRDLGFALSGSKVALGVNYTMWLPGLEAHKDTNDLYLTYVDGCGIHFLTIYLDGDFPGCQIHDFYIGSDYGSGLKYDNIEDFLDGLREEIMMRSDDGETSFNITIED